MPTYDYVCDACGHTFDEFQSMSAAALKTCPECKKRKLRRLIGAGAGLVFKGSGFYVNDYKKGGGEKKSEGGESKPESTSGSKADSKPEAKSDAKPSPKPESKGSSTSKSD